MRILESSEAIRPGRRYETCEGAQKVQEGRLELMEMVWKLGEDD